MAYQLTRAAQFELTEHVEFMAEDVRHIEQLLEVARLAARVCRQWVESGVVNTRDADAAKRYCGAAFALWEAVKAEPMPLVERHIHQVRAELADGLLAIVEAVEDGTYDSVIITE